MLKDESRTKTIAYLNSPFLLNEFTILSWSPSLKFGPSSLITDKGFTIANSLEDVDLAVEPWLKKDPSLRLFPHFCHSLRFYWRQANCNPVDNKVWFHFWNWNSLLDHVRVQLKFFDSLVVGFPLSAILWSYPVLYSGQVINLRVKTWIKNESHAESV